MPKASPIQTSFSGGEFGPELEGRVDTNEYQFSVKRMENMIPTLQGPAVRRAGSRFVKSVKTASDQTWLVRFEFSVEQAYVLEFGDQYIRFYLNHGQLLSGGSPYEISSPYAIADLTDADGFFNLDYVQSGDVVYFTHKDEDYPVYKLTRLGAVNWTMTEVDLQNGPFLDINPDQTTTLYASATTGTVTVIASSTIFATYDVGTRLYFEQPLTESATAWEPGKSITTNDIRKSDGKFYKALNTATTGTIQPTHSSGSVYDGDTGVQWQFLHAGFGYGKITVVSSTFTNACTMEVESTLPDDVIGASNATNRWAFGAFGDTRLGYPSLVSFFKERLVLFQSSSQRAFFSVAADFENFARLNNSGEVADDQAIIVDITGGEVNRFEWVVSGGDLILGTAGGEQIIRELSTERPFAPGNVASLQVSEYGSAPVKPVRVGSSILFVQRSGRKIREMSFSPTSQNKEGYGSFDLTVYTPHLFPRGTYITQMKYQQEPYSVVWVLRNDGLLIACRYTPNTQNVGFSRCPIGGSAVVEAIQTIPAPDGDRDELWLIANRTINGGTTRYVEWIEYEWDASQDDEDRFYVDSGATYDSTPASTITGLSHLEGETVDVLADGAVHPQRTVSSGQITLDDDYSVVQIGLPCPAKLRTLRLNAGSADGTAQGKTGRIHEVGFRFLDTLGGKFGPTESNLDVILFRGSDPMDAPPPSFTGDKLNLSFPDDYNSDNEIWYVNDQPLPVKLLAIMPRIVKQDD